MIVNKQLAVSTGHLQKDLWETPDKIYIPLHAEFGFTLDPYCTVNTAKCRAYFTPEDDGLVQSWAGHIAFVNPPYSRGNIDKWVKKCYEESQNALVVALLPVSTSSCWWHDWVWKKAELRYIKGRIRFTGAPFTAPFSSVIAIYNNCNMKITNAVDIDKKQIVLDGCMVTVSGAVIDLYNPDPNLITIGDIAHGLANNCRWNGHTQKFWSVAQHCCMMFDLAPAGEGLKYLLHDAEEAYWGDMIKPLKNKIKIGCPEIIELMRLMRHVIFDKFGVPYADKGVEDLDFKLLQWEFENIIKNKSAIFWPPDFAKQEFLDRFYSIHQP